MAVALVFIQWQRQLGVKTQRGIPVVSEQMPVHLAKHPEQPVVRVSFQLSGPQTALNFATERDFRFKVDVSALELGVNETERVVPLTSDMLTSILRPDIWRQLSVVEGSLVPPQMKLVILPAQSGDDIPRLPDPEEGVTSIVLLEWKKEVPVVVPFVGEPARGYSYTKNLNPPTVLLRGRREALQTIKAVTTEQSYDIEGQREDFVTVASLPDFEQGTDIELIAPATPAIQVEVKFFRTRGGNE